MRLFVSYARVDKPLCRQIIEVLNDAHEIWYDERLFAGMDWWEEIQYRLHWCDGLVYLLSPEAVKSDYCLKEYQIAKQLNKKIIPVLIQSGTDIPADLGIYQYLDLSKDIHHVVELLKALTIAERELREIRQDKIQQSFDAPPDTFLDLAGFRIGQKISFATQALNQGNHQRAKAILDEIKQGGNVPRAVLGIVERLLNEVEAAMERHSRERQLTEDYVTILELILDPTTRMYGVEAFIEFTKEFPNYDPEGVSVVVRELSETPQQQFHPPRDLPPPFVWCPIPSGRILLENTSFYPVPGTHGGEYFVPQFSIAKYPIRAAQYKAFLQAPDGFCNISWWDFSPDAYSYAQAHEAIPNFEHLGDLAPLTDISWYDATAFCRWMSYRTGLDVRLPTEQEWQLALLSDRHHYPTKVRASMVTNYYNDRPEMNSNLWEWCFNEWTTGYCQWEGTEARVLRGRLNQATQLELPYNRFYAMPWAKLSHVGFRVVCAGVVGV
jgi:hypothetical protein